MSELFPLHVFPQGSLASSVITTVWVGVLVAAFFHLRFGWVFSGLVVPGYLAPLLIVKPLSASVVLFEAVITYGIVWMLSEYASRKSWWCGLFGRDRFFALVLVSILVKVLMDGWLLPYAGDWIAKTWGLSFSFRDSLHSYGLIVISLLANQMWKPGLRRGLAQSLLILFITWFIIRHVLVEYTNFNIATVAYMYEDIAASLMATPKAYILLVISAYLASRMNLKYGWEFNGILIPSLIALQWYEPFKIVTSFAEAFIILTSASILLKVPPFRKMNMEGGRKFVFFFTVSFGYKMLLGFASIQWFPSVKVTDLFGLGYLLSTLMAMKMHDKNIALLLTRATLQTSLVAVFWASLVGFAFTHLPSLMSTSVDESVSEQIKAKERPKATLIDIVRERKLALNRVRRPDSIPQALPYELETFAQALDEIKLYRDEFDDDALHMAVSRLKTLNYSAAFVKDDEYLVIYEDAPEKGWGTYVINLGFGNQLFLQVPAPVSEWAVMESGAILFDSLNANALALAGSGRRTNRDGSSDVMKNYNTFFQVFHQAFSRKNIVQIRGYTSSVVRKLAGVRTDDDRLTPPQPESHMWVKGSIPPGLHLGELKNLLPEVEITWGKGPEFSIQRQSVSSGFCELYLNRDDRRQILYRHMLQSQNIKTEEGTRRIDGYLKDWVYSSKKVIAPKGSDAYVVPQVEEMLFFDEEVLSPLFDILHNHVDENSLTDEGRKNLRGVLASAHLMNYDLLLYHHRISGAEYLILSEWEDIEQRRYWGTYVFRIGHATPYIIQAPRPVYEINSFEFAVTLFEDINAEALLIAGAHPDANEDGSADLIQIEHKQHLFNLVSQVFVRNRQGQPVNIVQCRVFGIQPDRQPPKADLLFALPGIEAVERLSGLNRTLYDELSTRGLKISFVDGSPDTAGYEAGGIPQALYLRQATNADFVLLWLSPLVRGTYRQQDDNTVALSKFDAANIPTQTLDIHSALGEEWRSPPSEAAMWRREILEFSESRNIFHLFRINQNPSVVAWRRWVDIDSKLAFLVARDPKTGVFLFVASLRPRQSDLTVKFTSRPDRETVSEFIQRGAACLEKEDR